MADEDGSGAGPSRRELLASAARTAALSLAAALALSSAGPPLLRPPGWGLRSPSRCNGCLRCVQVCPTEALRPGDLADGLGALRRPVLDGECIFWNGSCLRCVAACPTGALEPVRLDQVRLGTARIDLERCIPWARGERCYVCYEHCPIKGAIVLSEAAVPKPAVRPDLCVGCGVCAAVCPVRPAAVEVLP